MASYHKNFYLVHFLLCLMSMGLASQTQAQTQPVTAKPVSIQVDLAQEKGPLKPIWSW